MVTTLADQRHLQVVMDKTGMKRLQAESHLRQRAVLLRRAEAQDRRYA